jgi:hypothetical protein
MVKTVILDFPFSTKCLQNIISDPKIVYQYLQFITMDIPKVFIEILDHQTSVSFYIDKDKNIGEFYPQFLLAKKLCITYFQNEVKINCVD